MTKYGHFSVTLTFCCMSKFLRQKTHSKNKNCYKEVTLYLMDSHWKIFWEKKKIKNFNLLFTKPKSGLADLWSLMEDKGRSGMIKTFLQVYFSNSNNNLRYVPYALDGIVTLSLYKATRPNLARPEGWNINFCQDLCPKSPWLTSYWFSY